MQPTKSAKRKLPYLTDEQLNAEISTVTLPIFGSYTKRGEQRKEVYEENYEAEIEVPANWNMGHVKLQANRHVKLKLHGIRARTYNVDSSQPAKKNKDKKKVRDFISQQGIMENEHAKRNYHEEQERKRRAAERDDEGGMPAPFSDDTRYGEDGLAPLSEKVYVG